MTARNGRPPERGVDGGQIFAAADVHDVMEAMVVGVRSGITISHSGE